MALNEYIDISDFAESEHVLATEGSLGFAPSRVHGLTDEQHHDHVPSSFQGSLTVGHVFPKNLITDCGPTGRHMALFPEGFLKTAPQSREAHFLTGDPYLLYAHVMDSDAVIRDLMPDDCPSSGVSYLARPFKAAATTRSLQAFRAALLSSENPALTPALRAVRAGLASQFLRYAVADVSNAGYGYPSGRRGWPTLDEAVLRWATLPRTGARLAVVQVALDTPSLGLAPPAMCIHDTPAGNHFTARERLSLCRPAQALWDRKWYKTCPDIVAASFDQGPGYLPVFLDPVRVPSLYNLTSSTGFLSHFLESLDPAMRTSGALVKVPAQDDTTRNILVRPVLASSVAGVATLAVHRTVVGVAFPPSIGQEAADPDLFLAPPVATAFIAGAGAAFNQVKANSSVAKPGFVMGLTHTCDPFGVATSLTARVGGNVTGRLGVRHFRTLVLGIVDRKHVDVNVLALQANVRLNPDMYGAFPSNPSVLGQWPDYGVLLAGAFHAPMCLNYSPEHRIYFGGVDLQQTRTGTIADAGVQGMVTAGVLAGAPYLLGVAVGAGAPPPVAIAMCNRRMSTGGDARAATADFLAHRELYQNNVATDILSSGHDGNGDGHTLGQPEGSYGSTLTKSDRARDPNHRVDRTRKTARRCQLHSASTQANVGRYSRPSAVQAYVFSSMFFCPLMNPLAKFQAIRAVGFIKFRALAKLCNVVTALAGTVDEVLQLLDQTGLAECSVVYNLVQTYHPILTDLGRHHAFLLNGTDASNDVRARFQAMMATQPIQTLFTQVGAVVHTLFRGSNLAASKALVDKAVTDYVATPIGQAFVISLQGVWATFTNRQRIIAAIRSALGAPQANALQPLAEAVLSVSADFRAAGPAISAIANTARSVAAGAVANNAVGVRTAMGVHAAIMVNQEMMLMAPAIAVARAPVVPPGAAPLLADPALEG